MNKKDKNMLLRKSILKKLNDIGGTPNMLIENELFFKVKGFPKCIKKYTRKDNVDKK